MNATLSTKMVEKPWGKDTLPAPFTASEGKRIGEVWFESPPVLDQLLVKYIFTSENLSVQVHPSDAQTEANGLGRRGKEECWTVIHAEPGARLGIGFKAPIAPEQLRGAALDGSIEDLLEWFAVRPGDFFYIPANTVHAIGGGVSLIEVQQNSDITYRLYDYGRPRELHLDDGIAVASGQPYDPALRRHLPDQGEVVLVDGPLFRMDRLDGPPSQGVLVRYGAGALILIPIDGAVRIGGEVIAPGSAGVAPRLGAAEVPEGTRCLFAQPLAAHAR